MAKMEPDDEPDDEPATLADLTATAAGVAGDNAADDDEV